MNVQALSCSGQSLGLVFIQRVCSKLNTLCTSEIYQVTGPVERFAGQIASQGFVVGMCMALLVNTIR